MSKKSKTDQYVDYINSDILPHIDYARLQKSYDTDMVYAKEILNRLHESMIDVYGCEYFGRDDGDEDGFVVVPGVVRGDESGKLCIVLLDIDLSSSGEHCGTSFLCKHGVVSQSDMAGTPAMKEIRETIGSYDYCYTATIPGDIHADESRLPAELKSFLKDFRNHRIVLTDEKWRKHVDVICNGILTTFPTRKVARDFFYQGMLSCEGSAQERYTAIFTELESTNKETVHDGGAYDTNPLIRGVGKFNGERIVGKKLLKESIKFDDYMDLQKPSVIEQIRTSEKTQNQPKKKTTARKKSEPEL